MKLNLSDFNESSRCTFDIQNGKPNIFYESIPYKVCCGNKIPITDFRNWYFFYSHALQFPRHSMGMKFPHHCVGISFPCHYVGMKFPQNGVGIKFPQTIRWNCIQFIILRRGVAEIALFRGTKSRMNLCLRNPKEEFSCLPKLIYLFQIPNLRGIKRSWSGFFAAQGLKLWAS